KGILPGRDLRILRKSMFREKNVRIRCGLSAGGNIRFRAGLFPRESGRNRRILTSRGNERVRSIRIPGRNGGIRGGKTLRNKRRSKGQAFRAFLRKDRVYWNGPGVPDRGRSGGFLKSGAGIETRKNPQPENGLPNLQD
ncbi:MAG: hypothetical protein K5922_00375, partial [Clostridiales bacterium]|nr:hypothetical protein [Clostridiales bacterium]